MQFAGGGRIAIGARRRYRNIWLSHVPAQTDGPADVTLWIGSYPACRTMRSKRPGGSTTNSGRITPAILKLSASQAISRNHVVRPCFWLFVRPP